MCTAKARIAKCGHTVAYDIMIPCKNHTAGGAPCPAWDEHLVNKVFLNGHPICIACHLDKERKICGEFVAAERELVRSKGGPSRSAREVWEARLASGGRMQDEVCALDEEVGREGSWREWTRRFDW